MLGHVPVRTYEDALDPSVRMPQRRAPLLEKDRYALLSGTGCELLPHLPGAQSWIPELLDERRHVLPLDSEEGQDRLAEREVLDSLRSPKRTNFRSGNPPHLFRVRAEEDVVPSLAEPRRHPLLERFRLALRTPCRQEI